MKKEQILKYFKAQNAILCGHFKLSSGLHSKQYLQSALLLQYPQMVNKLAKALASFFLKLKPSAVIGPALGGIILAYEIARILKAKALFTERKDGIMMLRRGFEILPNEKILVVEDVITTGGSVKEVIDVVKEKKGKVVGIGSLVNRAEHRPTFGVKYKTLLNFYVPTYSESKCPLCQKNIPIIIPGSKKFSKTL